MPRGSNPLPTPLGRAVSEVLDAKRSSQGITARQLILLAGLKPHRGYDLLSGEAAWTITELQAICAALELKVSGVVLEAELATRSTESLATTAARGNIRSLRPNTRDEAALPRVARKGKITGDDGSAEA